jgi:hypothetical protein
MTITTSLMRVNDDQRMSHCSTFERNETTGLLFKYGEGHKCKPSSTSEYLPFYKSTLINHKTVLKNR